MMQTAIVTGGAGGIGEAICLALAQAGYRVVVLDANREAGDRIASRCAGGSAFAVDVTDEVSVRQAYEASGAQADLLVNAAGIVLRGPVLDRPLADFRRVLDVNLMGTVTPTYVVARHMLKRGSGVIINIASIVGAVVSGIYVGAYAAAKAGMAAFSAQMALELRPHVRVNTIAPGMIDAGIGSAQTYADPESLRARVAAQPAGRLGTPTDIASATVFLASDSASFINGQTIVVDGGLSGSVLAQLSVARR